MAFPACKEILDIPKDLTQAPALTSAMKIIFSLKKVGFLMPWFVNAFFELTVADFYRKNFII